MYTRIKLYRKYIIYSCFILIEAFLIDIFFNSMILAAVFAVAMFIYADIGGELFSKFSMGCRPLEYGNSNAINKVNRSFENVKNKVELKFACRPNINLYYIPTDEINAYSLGRKTIGITTGAMNSLDSHIIEAVISHEIGHSINGDMFLYRFLFGNLVAAMLVIGLWNAVFIGVIVFIGILLFAFTGMRYNYIAYHISSAILNIVRKIMAAIKNILFKVGEAIIAVISRKSEYKADEFAFLLGYGKYLCIFLEKYDTPISFKPRSIIELVYSTHPDNYKRIQRLNRLN